MLSAAKQVTTVAEAPSIVTVVRADEIQTRGYRNITQVLETIPGWLSSSNGGSLLSIPLVRGTAQAALLLRDGVSMFEPVLNVGTYNRGLPLETVKRRSRDRTGRCALGRKLVSWHRQPDQQGR